MLFDRLPNHLVMIHSLAMIVYRADEIEVFGLIPQSAFAIPRRTKKFLRLPPLRKRDLYRLLVLLCPQLICNLVSSSYPPRDPFPSARKLEQIHHSDRIP